MMAFYSLTKQSNLASNASFHGETRPKGASEFQIAAVRFSGAPRTIFELEGASINEFAARFRKSASYAHFEIPLGASSMFVNEAIRAEIAEVETKLPLTQDRFNGLAMDWLCGMGYSSNPSALTAHPSYKAIIAYGNDAVPFVLAQLRRAPSLLAWTLFDITRENPVKKSEHGDLAKITRAWIKWGRNKKLIK
jgi:hypothetical protein